jgi:hypothetical protein
MKPKPFLVFIAFISAMTLQAQNAKQAIMITGIWKGTSLCQVKPSPCHDEVVVYHISTTEKGNEYAILMNKIVNGAEEEMATISATYNPATKELTGIMKGRPVWHFIIKDKIMDGKLVLENGTLYRIIHVERQ